ncbi:sensor histidine kinase [Paenibacillus sp. CAU 1782]
MESPLDIGQWEGNPNYIVQTLTLPSSDWKLVSIIPRGELLEELDTVRRFNLIAYLLIACIVGLFLFIFFARILKPVRQLIDFIKAYARRGGEIRFQIVHNNEIGVLGMNLNKMLDDIDNLSKEIQETQARMYEIELSKKQMEIIAFRNQINPHFLYNTLESIRAVALHYEVEMIADISNSLSNMFRYAVKGSHMVLIRDEIANIREYAKIIDFRFMGRFSIAIEAEDEVLEEQMLKMLLQPIVENAVFHGLERKVGRGSVVIGIRYTEYRDIQFSITDDGQGMDKERYDKLMETFQQLDNGFSHQATDKGIGLLNIYQRLRLFYGDDASMAVESEPQRGTVITLTFPADNKDREEYADVYRIDRG